MNDLLNEVSKDAASQMEEILSLFDVLHLLPNNANVPSSILQSDKDECGDDVKALKTKLQRLYKLQIKAQSNLTDKSKRMLGDLLVEILTLVKSNLKLQELLSKDGAHASLEDHRYKTLKHYCDKVKNVGSRNISISEQDDKRNVHVLFKLIEKCKRLDMDIATGREGLRERILSVDAQRSECALTLKTTRTLGGDTKLKVISEHEAREKTAAGIIEVMTAEHQKITSELQTELSSIQKLLQKQIQEHWLEKEGAMERLDVIPLKRERIKNEHNTQKQQRLDEMRKVQDHNAREVEEKERLQMQYNLILSNKKISAEESRRLQQVMAMQKKADAIIFNAAVTFQKIARGVRDRCIVRKMRKKKSQNEFESEER